MSGDHDSRVTKEVIEKFVHETASGIYCANQHKLFALEVIGGAPHPTLSATMQIKTW